MRLPDQASDYLGRPPNEPAGGNAGAVLQFAIDRHCPGVPQPVC